MSVKFCYNFIRKTSNHRPMILQTDTLYKPNSKEHLPTASTIEKRI
ncbi:733_t:CDS:1, partial [Scutellospora calospora]